MAWFRRSRPVTEGTTDEPTADPVAPSPGGDLLPVPVVSTATLERTERALRMLAVQSSQLHAHLVELEDRVDALSAGLLERLEIPTYDDVIATRVHTAKVASELSRLEVNVSARLEAVLAEVRSGRDTGDIETGDIDLRVDPSTTGWPAGAVR